ncbi:MAG TPA: hypothetical protein VF266_11865 [Thermoanaerobaculia bacterium]
MQATISREGAHLFLEVTKGTRVPLAPLAPTEFPASGVRRDVIRFENDGLRTSCSISSVDEAKSKSPFMGGAKRLDGGHRRADESQVAATPRKAASDRTCAAPWLR